MCGIRSTLLVEVAVVLRRGCGKFLEQPIDPLKQFLFASLKPRFRLPAVAMLLYYGAMAPGVNSAAILL